LSCLPILPRRSPPPRCAGDLGSELLTASKTSSAPLDALISHDHPARIVWTYVEGLDRAPLYDRIEAAPRA
jgi:hypothetical protein